MAEPMDTSVWESLGGQPWRVVRDSGGISDPHSTTDANLDSWAEEGTREREESGLGAVYLRFCALGDGCAYAALALSQDYTEAWLAHCTVPQLDAMIKRDLPRIYIAAPSLTSILDAALSKGSQSGGQPASIRLAHAGSNAERSLHITVSRRLTTQGSEQAGGGGGGGGGGGVQLAWTIDFVKLPAETLNRRVLVPMLVKPLLGVYCYDYFFFNFFSSTGTSVGLAHSHDLLQSMHAAKDRALQTFVQTYGAQDVKRVPQALAADVFFPALFAAPEWGEKVCGASLSQACVPGGTLQSFFATACDAQRQHNDVAHTAATPPQRPQRGNKRSRSPETLSDHPAGAAVTGRNPAAADVTVALRHTAEGGGGGGGGGGDAAPSTLHKESSYLETIDERLRREGLTQKLTQKKAPETGVGQQGRKRQKVKNAFT